MKKLPLLMCCSFFIPLVLSAQDYRTPENQYSLNLSYDTVLYPSVYNIKFILKEYFTETKEGKRTSKSELMTVDTLKAILVRELNKIGIEKEPEFNKVSFPLYLDGKTSTTSSDFNYFFELKGMTQDTLIQLVKNIRFKGLTQIFVSPVFSNEHLIEIGNLFQKKGIEEANKQVATSHDKSINMRLLGVKTSWYEVDGNTSRNFVYFEEQYRYIVSITYLISCP